MKGKDTFDRADCWNFSVRAGLVSNKQKSETTINVVSGAWKDTSQTTTKAVRVQRVLA